MEIEKLESQIPSAVLEPPQRWSSIWLLPLIALLIASWLAYKTLSEKGPEVLIVFPSAAGIVAGKTVVKYKDVEVGLVKSVNFSTDLKSVEVQAQLAREMHPYLTEKTRFWIVSAQVAAGKVSGLDTLLSGVYIGMEPGQEGAQRYSFQGLPHPPIIRADRSGKTLHLRADSLGSLDIGAPVYFRRMLAGRLAEHELDANGRSVKLKLFINAPYDQLVTPNSRFWNASGFNATLNADGLTVQTESVAALLVGGIAFDTPPRPGPSPTLAADHEFRLFDSKAAAEAPVYKEAYRYLMYFPDSLRGLRPGAPVEFRGMRLGQVVDMHLVGDADNMSFKIPVLIELEPKRMDIRGQHPMDAGEQGMRQALQHLIAKGFRGQLKTGSLITGQLYVDLDFYPDAPPAELIKEEGYFVIPSVPGTLEELKGTLSNLMAKVQQLPLEEMLEDARASMRGVRELTTSPALLDSLQHLNQTLAQLQQLTQQLNRQTAPQLGELLNSAETSLQLAQRNWLSEDAKTQREMARALEEISQAARSVRILLDYLERHPDALLKGK